MSLPRIITTAIVAVAAVGAVELYASCIFVPAPRVVTIEVSRCESLESYLDRYLDTEDFRLASEFATMFREAARGQIGVVIHGSVVESRRVLWFSDANITIRASRQLVEKRRPFYFVSEEVERTTCSDFRRGRRRRLYLDPVCCCVIPGAPGCWMGSAVLGPIPPRVARELAFEWAN